MRRVMLVCLLMGLCLVCGHADKARVTLRVSPNTIQTGQNVQLACFIPLEPYHRFVEMGIDGYTSSSRTIEGENGPRVFVRTFVHVPCSVGDPYCRVDGRESVKGRLLVTGCP